MKKFLVVFLTILALTGATLRGQLRDRPYGPATVTAVDQQLRFDNLEGMGTASVQVVGTFVATFTPACSNDGGTTWVAIEMTDATGSTVTEVTTTGLYTSDTSKCKQFRLRATSYTSGTALLYGNAKMMGGGVSGVGVSGEITGEVTVSNLAQDSSQAATAQSSGPQLMGLCDTTADTVTTGQAQRVRVDCETAAVYTRTVDPCQAEAKTYYVVNISTATTVEIANAVASEFFYICSVNLVAAAAQTIAIGEDDTDGCGSITAGLHGGATATTGWSFATNGGIVLGNGSGTVLKTATAARYLCVITGQVAQISGTVSYVSAP